MEHLSRKPLSVSVGTVNRKTECMEKAAPGCDS